MATNVTFYFQGIYCDFSLISDTMSINSCNTVQPPGKESHNQHLIMTIAIKKVDNFSPLPLFYQIKKSPAMLGILTLS